MRKVHSKIIIWILASFGLWITISLFACSTSSTGDDIDDGTAPDIVTDLAVIDFDTVSITLSWTATGDDDDVGTASSYDIRYLTYPLMWNNWDSAVQVSGEPSPQPSGSTETFTITGLMEDTTYYIALRVYDEEGNTEGISNVVSATCVYDFTVTFPDSNLESVIREILNKPQGDILKSELITIEDLSANSRDITNLNGLEHCTNLIYINMIDNNIDSLYPLADLDRLFSLNMMTNQIGDLAPLASLTSLERLYITDNQISDISHLSGLTILKQLSLSYNEIDDISPLSGLTALQVLSIAGNQFTDISPLSGLTDLEELYLGGNSIGDLSPLSGLTNLKWLYIEHCSIDDISGLSGLSNLEALKANSNIIDDLSPLAGLTSLTDLDLNYNQYIVSLDSLVDLINLNKLALRQNSITDISPLLDNSGLGTGDTIWLYENPLSQQSREDYVDTLRARGATVFVEEPE